MILIKYYLVEQYEKKLEKVLILNHFLNFMLHCCDYDLKKNLLYNTIYNDSTTLKIYHFFFFFFKSILILFKMQVNLFFFLLYIEHIIQNIKFIITLT